MQISELDVEMLCVSSMNLMQEDEHIWHRQFGRFENFHADRPDAPMRKEWSWGHWIDGEWAALMLVRQFLIDNGHDFEIFYDLSYPTERGGWVIFTDYYRER